MALQNHLLVPLNQTKYHADYVGISNPTLRTWNPTIGFLVLYFLQCTLLKFAMVTFLLTTYPPQMRNVICERPHVWIMANHLLSLIQYQTISLTYNVWLLKKKTFLSMSTDTYNLLHGTQMLTLPNHTKMLPVVHSVEYERNWKILLRL